jgi:radical SAM superfamily enzyme YgiQ (UPF0313 family)
MRVVVHQFDDLGHMRTFPLAAGQIVAAARQAPALADATFQIETGRRPIEAQLDRYARPDVFGFSLYVWNLQHSLAVARAARVRFPEALIVCGGPSTPRDAERARAFLDVHDFIDVLVLGEGEVTFADLLCRWAEGLETSGLAGTVTRKNGGLVFGPPRPRIRDFTRIASPYLDGTLATWLRDKAGVTAGLLETNRGCPFRCTFCDWGQATASRVNDIPLDRVFREIEWFAEREVPYLYLIDANFGIRKRDPEIVGRIAELKRSHGAPFFCYFHLTKNATVRNLATVETLMRAEIGCHIAISMQSFEPKVLQAIERDNISLDVYEQLRQTCAERGIPTANELLLGLPEQTLDGFLDGMIRTLSRWPADSFFLYPVRLLENSAMASTAHRIRYRLRTRMSRVAPPQAGQGEMELEEVVVATSTLPLEEWRHAFFFGSLLSAFYNLHIAGIVLQAIRESGCDVRGWIEAVLAAIQRAPEGSIFAALGNDFAGLADALIAGDGALRVRVSDLPGGPWEAHELMGARALLHYEAFCAELLDSTRRWHGDDDAFSSAQLDELFTVQRLAVPSWPRRESETLECQWDWATWWRDVRHGGNGSPLLRNDPVKLRYQPPPHLLGSPDEEAFVLAHIGQAYAKQWRPELSP